MPGLCETPVATMATAATTASNEPGHSLRPKRMKVSHNDKSEDMGPQHLWKVTNRPDYTPIIYQPYDVIFKEDQIVVAEGLWPYSRIHLFNLQGRSKKIIGKGQVLPFGLTLTPGGQIATTDHKERTLKIFDPDNNEVTSWPCDLLDWPNGVTMNSHGQFLIADWSKGIISIHDDQGDKIKTIKTTGNGINEFSCPEYVITDRQDHIYLSDAYDHSVKVFDGSGSFRHQFGHEAGPGKIKDPRGLALDRHGNILVADWGGSCVKRYAPDGKWLGDVLTPSHGIQYPWGIDYQSEGGLLVITEHKLNCAPALQLFRWEN